MFGLVWINMDNNCESLEEFLGEQICRELDSYKMEKMVRVLNITADAPCNWKIITDNFNEAYHVQVLHPGLIPYIEANYKACQFDLFKNGHNRGWFPSHNPSILHNEEKLGDHLVAVMEQWKLNPDEYQAQAGKEKIRHAIQTAKRQHSAEMGYHHYADYADYQMTDYIIYNLFPNSVITVGPDGVQLLRPRPHPSGDPKRCLFDHWWMVHEIEGHTHTPSPAGGPDLPIEDAEHEMVMHGEKSLGTTADEDLSIAKIQQQGLASAGYQHFYLPHQERRVQHFHEVLNDRIANA
jgi:phenylpropionate dioxygenase-like ring-hydroxylating dioxygenase large terminal subunit